MKQILQHVGSGELEVAEVPEPACMPGGIVVRTAASLISSGTEKSIVDFAGKSLLGKVHERPDLVRKVIGKVRTEGVVSTIRTVTARLDDTVALGYSCAGVVDAVGVGAEEFSVGQRVACAGMGYASHASVVSVPKNLAVAVPDGVSLDDAAYVTLGAIALQGIRITAPTLGECVVVIGLGVLGLLTAQLLRANGCRVIAIDLDAARVARAKALGADVAVTRADDATGTVSRFTAGIGADAVIVTAATDSADPLDLAGDVCRSRGRVVVVGAVKMEVPRETYYMKELELRLSRSYGPGRYDPSYEVRGHDYPIGYVRWTERRNMEEFLRLVASGAVTPSALTTHRFPIDRAGDAYDIVIGKVTAAFAGIMLEYGETTGASRTRTVRLKPRAASSSATGVGVIGAGGFASSTLLPRISKRTDLAMMGVATAHGVTSSAAAKRFGFSYATTDAASIIADPDIGIVVVATRHGLHAALAAAALRAGKDVFVEKPLALDDESLLDVLDAQRESGRVLAVGFNRRFSPLAADLKRALPGNSSVAIHYRVNAGPLPAESWIRHREDGGGRIVGEVCHFVDFCSFLVDDAPREVFGYAAGGNHDIVSIVIKYENGSTATINYFANGDTTVPKERVEVFQGGCIALLDDFRELHVTYNRQTVKQRLRAQDKGFDGELDSFFRAVREGGLPPIALESIAATTRTTFVIERSLLSGRPERVTP
ncbi:MAG: bi-domain-containing oxidoreductase [Gemmatimonadaceae bacterium]